MAPTLESIRKAYGLHWNPIFNLGAIRSGTYGTNDFNDLVFYASDSQFFAFNATTDPGDNEIGTATMKAGFYPKLYSFGFHKGNKNHPCFRQAAPAQYYRRRSDKLFDEATVVTGVFGTNVHSTRPDFTPENVDDWSKGCIVVKRWESFQKILDAAHKSGLSVFDFYLLQESQVL